MRNNKKKSQDLFAKIATCFGIGYLSPFPGTLGSALAFVCLPLVLFFSFSGTQIFLISLALFILGVYSSTRYELLYSLQDPCEVIIDELVAQTILLLWLCYTFRRTEYCSTTLLICTASFVLFRFFDITKPWPINLIQKNIHGGVGIMLDDLLAAVMTFIIIILSAHVSL